MGSSAEDLVRLVRNRQSSVGFSHATREGIQRGRFVLVSTDQYIALGGAISTLLGVIITWLVARRTLHKKQLSYQIRMDALISSKMADPGKNLVIRYGEDILPQPALLSVDITNTGNVPVENPPIKVEAPGHDFPLLNRGDTSLNWQLGICEPRNHSNLPSLSAPRCKHILGLVLDL